MSSFCRLLLAMIALLPAVATADRVTTTIDGVDGELLDNVRAHLALVQAAGMDNLSIWRVRAMVNNAEDEVRAALRPYGFYQPVIDVRLDESEQAGVPHRAHIRVRRGDPVRVTRLELAVDGGNEAVFDDWLRDWPLPEGAVLRQPLYDEAKRDLTAIAERSGYFQGRFQTQRITVDPSTGSAHIQLDYLPGARARFSQIQVSETRFSDRLIDRLTTIEPGEYYATEKLDRQRDVLMRSGYFERLLIDEQVRAEDGEVDLDYQLEPRPPNTYRATIGFGTDTGARLQLGWLRHYLSGRGDRLNLGFGAQQRNSEFVVRADYQHPRGRTPDNFLTGGVLLRQERDSFRFNDENRREAVFESFSGDRRQAELTIGRLREREALSPPRYEPLRERIFVSYLRETFDALNPGGYSDEQAALLAANPEIAPFLDTRKNVLALGVEWTLFNIQGSGFSTRGEHFQLRFLGSSKTLGSDVSFLQGYASARWHWLISDRQKLILRGEIGYTEATTRNLNVQLDDRQLDLSITELPELYRFKTGGDRTVRGYGFERLSTNRNGANHIMTSSVEYEFRVGESWSLAAFYDQGNAFNDFASRKLKRGVGVGFRWYTVIGPIQVDLARALDDAGRPLRLHFTIGTSLL